LAAVNNPVNILKQGDRVLCRDASGFGGQGLTEGSEYEVSSTVGNVGEVSPFDIPLGFIMLKEDYKQRLYDPRRFSLVLPEDELDVGLGPGIIPIKAKAAALANTMAAVEHAVEIGEPLTKADMVTLPHHYARFKIEPVRFICENNLNFFQANIVKYVLRHDAKNGLEDLKKARRYLDMFILFIEGDESWWCTPNSNLKEAA
jgi:hypothetical protein